jgi:hypothetical protein
MDRLWPLRDMLPYWVSPWPQPQARKATREHEARKGEQAGCIYPQGKLPRRLMHILCPIRSGWQRQSPDVQKAD